jgi:hypothetical protein
MDQALAWVFMESKESERPTQHDRGFATFQVIPVGEPLWMVFGKKWPYDSILSVRFTSLQEDLLWLPKYSTFTKDLIHSDLIKTKVIKKL